MQKKLLTYGNRWYILYLESRIYAKSKREVKKMINKNKFKGKVVEAGYNMTTFAEVIEMDTSTLYRKVNGSSVFTVKEVETIARELHLTEKEIIEIFFAYVVA